MKKYLFVALVFILSQATTKAQKFYVYDTEGLSVLMTCNDQNTTVTGIEYANGSEWLPYKIVKGTGVSSGHDGEGGYIFRLQDQSGKEFVFNYYRSSDYVKITCESTGEEWTLTRRPEEAK